MADGRTAPRKRRLAFTNACDELATDQSPDAALRALDERAAGSTALVGHEPHLSSLASLLLGGTPSAVKLELKKGAVMHLSLSEPVASGEALLRWSVSPKILRAVGSAG